MNNRQVNKCSYCRLYYYNNQMILPDKCSICFILNKDYKKL